MERDRKASVPRKLTLSLKHHGDDPRYAMWTHRLGNDMTLKVNEANGNLLLNVPLDTLATPVDDLNLSLTYNHQVTEDVGLGAGWDVAAGPASSALSLPTKLTDMGDDGIKVKYGNGGVRYFPKKDGRVYGGSGAGTIKKNQNDTYTLLTGEGGLFTFTTAGELKRAKPVATADSGGKAFDYTFTSGKLTKVTDALGRAMDITWGDMSTGQPTIIESWDTHPDTGQRRRWTLEYESGRLKRVINPETETVELFYDGGRLSEVRDGQQVVDGVAGWRIEYGADSTGLQRVEAVRPPGAPDNSFWDFSYLGPFTGTTALRAFITDPRGTATGTEGDFQTIVDFNYAGLPVRTAGPADQFGVWPVTTQVWDTNNNLACRRSPPANAVAELCTVSAGTADPLNTEYAYDTRAPYRLLSVTHPAPNSNGTGERATESYTYDNGWSFRGLWAEVFDNANLEGIPATEEIWTDFDQDWGNSRPPGLTDNDFWSVRLSGILEIDTTATYKFRIWSNDGVALTVEGATILDCLGEVQSATDYNCGTNQDVKKKLWGPGIKDITIEFREAQGPASLHVKWDKGNGNWLTIGTGALAARLGLVTKKDGPLAGITYKYPTDEAKARRLPDEETTSDPAPEPDTTRTTTYGYDEFGRATTTTAFAGTPQVATTVNSYLDGGGAATACLTKTTDPTGAISEFQCNGAGNVTSVTQKVRAVADQPAQDRITTTTYDAVGRVERVDPPGPAVTVTTRDKAGRPRFVDQLIDDKGTPDPADDVHAITEYRYDQAGRLKTEILPEVPGPAGGTIVPQVTHNYDWADQEISRTDPRNAALLWQTAYDASGRAIASTTPSGLVTATEYRLEDTLGNYLNQIKTTDPSGVSTVTTLGIQGRTVSEKTGTLDPTTYEYDVVGNVTKVTSPGGAWVAHAYNGFGEVTQETTLNSNQGGPNAVTTFTYNPAGRLTERNGPRTDVDDRLTYTYDPAGRLTEATQPGIGTPNTTTVVYDDAGERVRVTTPGSPSIVRNWIYDVAGRPVTFTDSRGTTQNRYNAAGWLVESDDPRGLTLHFDYDRLGRSLRQWATGGSGEVPQAFKYDAAGNMTEAKEEASGVTALLEYDDDGRLKKVTQGSAITTNNFHPTTGQLSSVVDPTGTTELTYNTDGLLHTLRDPLTSLLTTYSYDTAGRPKTRTDPAGLLWERFYDQAGRADRQTVKHGGNTLASFDLAYDIAGNVMEKAQTVSTAPASENGTWSYTYDPAGRLKTATDPGTVTTTYGYDGAGNRTSVKIGAGPERMTTFDGAGLPLSSDGGTPADPSDDTTYQHDAAGNMTLIQAPDRDFTYAYDPWGRLTSARGPSDDPLVTYAHDGLNRTLTRSTGGQTTTYVYVGTTEDPATATTGGVETKYAYSPGGPLAQKQGTDTRFYLRDLHADVVGLTNLIGTVQGTVAYSSWGEKRSPTGESSMFGFQGDPTDPTTGLVDMVSRLYDPGLGRFTTRDVLFGDPANPISLNQYVYGAASPVLNTDFLGLCANPSICPAPPGSSSAQKRRWFSLGATLSAASADYYFSYNRYLFSRSTSGGTYSPPRPTAGPRVGLLQLTARDRDIATPGKWMSPADPKGGGAPPVLPPGYDISPDAPRGPTSPGGALDILSGTFTGAKGVDDRASLYGRMLRGDPSADARSAAGGKLRRWGGNILDDAMDSRAFRLAGRAAGPLGFAADFAGNLSEGHSVPEATGRSFATAGGGYLGAKGGLLIGCLFGPWGCAIGAIVGGVGGSWIVDHELDKRFG